MSDEYEDEIDAFCLAMVEYMKQWYEDQDYEW